jgi:hypothetical protein
MAALDAEKYLDRLGMAAPLSYPQETTQTETVPY